MAHLVLHIGAHKTGTSYLQQLFYLNKELLEKHGVYCPHLGPYAAHHVLAMPWIDMPELSPYFILWGGVEGIWEQFLAECVPREGTVFVSSELFSKAQLQSVNMQELADRLSGFESVKIVYTVREQVDFIQSIWLQIAKGGQAQPLNAFIKFALSKHMATGVWLDHGKVLDHIETGFSPSQIDVFDYETIRHSENGMVGSFLELLGVQLPTDQLEKVSKRYANISPDPISSYFASILSPKTIPSQSLLRDIQAGLDLAENLPTTLFTREEIGRIETEFSPYNAALEQRVNVFQPDFQMRKPVRDENLIFREDIALDAYINLARRMLAKSDIG